MELIFRTKTGKFWCENSDVLRIQKHIDFETIQDKLFNDNCLLQKLRVFYVLFLSSYEIFKLIKIIFSS